MSWLGSVLLTASSPVVTDLLSIILRTHCKSLDTACSVEEAQALVAGNPDLSLIIVDADLEGGGGMDLLESVLSRGGPRPSVVFITARPDRDEETRAFMLGAIAYLTKPIRFREIARAVSASKEEFVPTADRVRTFPVGEAIAVDFEHQTEEVAWDISDLSTSGALLSTNAPMAVGTELRLILRLDEILVPANARVVRVQEPGWATIPGVAVEFSGLSDAMRQAIRRHVDLLVRRAPQELRSR